MHGAELAALAEAQGRDARASRRRSRAASRSSRRCARAWPATGSRGVSGILNGTCNYILTTMRETGRDFAEVLAEAQKLGYAEADPSFDVDGIDAAHKLAILAALAFGAPVDFAAVHVEGIRQSRALDIALRRGARLPHQAARASRAMTEHGLEQRVHPCMVPVDAPIAQVEGVFNAVVAEGDFVGRPCSQGRGAGAGPTASAVVADLIDIARGRQRAGLRRAGGSAGRATPAVADGAPSRRLLLRLMVVDRPGVIADVTAVLRDERGLDRIDDPARRAQPGRGGAGRADHPRDRGSGDARARSTRIAEPARRCSSRRALIRIEQF